MRHWKTKLQIKPNTEKGKITTHSQNVVDCLLSFIKNDTIIYKKEWCYLNREILGKYKTHLLKELVREGYLICDGIYNKGKKCYGYKINKSRINEIGFKERKKPNPIYNKIKEKLNSWGVDELNDTNKVLRQYMLELFASNRVKLNSNYKKVLNALKIEDELKGTDKYHNNFYMSEKINNGDWYITFDKNENRFYTPLHGLSSQIYSNVMIDNELLVEIDLSASFFQSLLILAQERKVNLDYNFVEDLMNGKFYESLNHNKVNRGEFKVQCLAWLMSSPYQKENIYTEINELFKKQYPRVYEFVKNIKDIYIPLNRIESSCFKTLSISLFQEGIPNLTKHDALFLKESDYINNKEYIENYLRLSGFNIWKITNHKKEREIKDNINKIKYKAKLHNDHIDQLNDINKIKLNKINSIFSLGNKQGNKQTNKVIQYVGINNYSNEDCDTLLHKKIIRKEEKLISNTKYENIDDILNQFYIENKF